MPNKNGGHAPNYTPACTVDIDSGMIVDSTVLNVHNEDGEMLDSVDRVREKFGKDRSPERLLADGLMATGDNISGCMEQRIDLYSPMKTTDPGSNPAIRQDLTTPVAEADYNRLPRKRITVDGEKREQLSKDAFVYDSGRNVYYCPAGQELSYRGSTTEKRQSGRTRTRERFRIDAKICADCPLAELCIRRQGAGRQVTHEEHESDRVAHAKKMATDEAKEIYKTRQHASERPFAMIKWFFGVQMFLTRGLSKVSQEFDWLSAGFNLHRLVSLHRARAGPASIETHHAPCSS